VMELLFFKSGKNPNWHKNGNHLITKLKKLSK